MNLDFLDNGTPIEHNESIQTEEEFFKFMQYCKGKGKTPSQLSQAELEYYYNN